MKTTWFILIFWGLCILPAPAQTDFADKASYEYQEIVSWSPQESGVFLYRFGFHYNKQGALARIILIISKNEVPGQMAQSRSPEFTFTESQITSGSLAGKKVWSGVFDWNIQVYGKLYTQVHLDLKTEYLSSPIGKDDVLLKGQILYYPDDSYMITDRQEFLGGLFTLSTQK